MASILKASNDRYGRLCRFADQATDETLRRFQACLVDEDFIGAGHTSIPAAGAPATGYPWVQKTVHTTGSPSVAVVPNSPAGIVQLAVDATAEKQEATLYANDQRNWDVTKGLTWEARLAFATVPGTGVEAVFGLSAAWVDGPDNAAAYVRFQASGSGLVNMQAFDGVTAVTGPTGVTLAPGAFHLFRIDAYDVANVCFFIDGAQISAKGQFAFAATAPASVLQPYLSVYKAGGTGMATMQVDAIQAGADRV
jgi:hypothetical protein